MGVDDVFNGEVANKAATATEAARSGESSDQSSLAPETAESSKAVLDLDKAEKVMFNGREMTLKELKTAYMQNRDYTQKTQEIAREREQYREALADRDFMQALKFDLDKVRGNPMLADQFRQIYPEKFHAYLDYILPKTDQGGQRIDPDLQAFKNEFQEMKSHLQEQRVQAAESEISAHMAKLAPKYPLADPETVLVRATAANAQGVKLTADNWEKIYKQLHEKTDKLYKDHYSKQVKEQQSANRKGREMSPGGGTVGAAPKKRTFDEATADAIRELSDRH